MQAGSCGIDPAQGAPISVLVRGKPDLAVQSTPKAGKQVSENLSYTRDGGVLQSHLPVQRSKEISTLAQHRARAPTQVRIEASLESASLKTDAYFSYSFRQKGFYSSSVLRL